MCLQRFIVYKALQGWQGSFACRISLDKRLSIHTKLAMMQLHYIDQQCASNVLLIHLHPPSMKIVAIQGLGINGSILMYSTSERHCFRSASLGPETALPQGGRRPSSPDWALWVQHFPVWSGDATPRDWVCFLLTKRNQLQLAICIQASMS